MTDPVSTGGGKLKPPLNAPLHELRNGFMSAEVCSWAVGREFECSAGPVAMERFIFTWRFKCEELRLHNPGNFGVHT